MSTALNEITYLRLQEFRRRRLTLAAARGWSAVIMVFAGTLFIAVVVDALSTHSMLRWMASGCVYLGTLATWFWSCWRPSRIREPLQFEAKRFEEADPRLRENLLTAVEFAEHHEPLHDSAAFKELLQSQVSHLIAPVDVRQLLPWHLVRRWLFVAATALSVLLLLSFIPQLHWMNRVARALFPAANLERVAQVAIVIEEPRPNSKNIAAGDIIGVVARIDGPIPDRVLIECRSIDGAANLIEMHRRTEAVETDQPISSSRFQATISTDQPWIDYRITASDASTAWHRLKTQPRPDVLHFTKTLTPPGYSQMAEVVQDDVHGNIRAITGTRAKLALQLNQSVNVAELRWQTTNSNTDTAGESKLLRLNRDEKSGLYVAEFTIELSETYRIHLQSAETGFINEFSPTYSVEAVVDQKPEIAWTKPASTKQIVAPDQILSLEAQIQDEMPVDTLKQMTRIDGDSQWKETLVTTSSLKPFKVEVLRSLAGNRELTTAVWQVDLLQFSTRVGDTVEMKLIALDRLKQSAESEVIEFLISESTITRLPTPAEQLRLKVATDLESFDQRIKQSELEIKELVKPNSTPQSDIQLQSQSSKLVEAAQTLDATIRSEVPKLLKLIEQAATQTEDIASLLELEQAGQTLSMLKTRNAKELTTVSRELAQTNQELTAKRRNELEKELVQHVHRLEDTGEATATIFRSMVSQDVGRRLSEQVAKLEQVFANFGENNSQEEPFQNLEQHLRHNFVAKILQKQKRVFCFV